MSSSPTGISRDDNVAATTDPRAAIARERETRHWTPAQWKEATPGGQNWPGYIATVRREADAAVDRLLEAVEQIAAGEYRGTDLGVVLDAQDIARKALNG